VVTADATLIVRAPRRTSLEYILDLIEKKKDWIVAKQKEAIARGGGRRPKKFIDGEEFLYLGKPYHLRIEDCKSIKIVEDEDTILFPRKFLTDPTKKMVTWYKKMALITIDTEARRWIEVMHVNYTSLKITSAKTRWGSCSGTNINFTWRLIMAPLEAVEYVVVHELAHIHEKNHGRRFWESVKKVLPEYRKCEQWLKDNQKFLDI
jgi:predicted metal-dependent hydrolase